MNPNENNGAQSSNDLPPYAQPTPPQQPAQGSPSPKGSGLRMPTHSRHHNSRNPRRRRRTPHPNSHRVRRLARPRWM